MFWFKEKDSELLIKEMPLSKWLIGSFFFFMPFLTVLISCFDKNLPTLLAGVFTFPFTLVFFYVLYSFPFITITINRFKKNLSIEKQTIFNYELVTVSFHELNGSMFISEKTVWSQTTYFIKIPLKDNSKVENLMELETSNHDFYKAVEIMNDYLQKTSNQIPIKNDEN